MRADRRFAPDRRLTPRITPRDVTDRRYRELLDILGGEAGSEAEHKVTTDDGHATPDAQRVAEDMARLWPNPRRPRR